MGHCSLQALVHITHTAGGILQPCPSSPTSYQCRIARERLSIQPLPPPAASRLKGEGLIPH
eukprot:20248-Eustigmatos_ZCMA.PRE.1